MTAPVPVPAPDAAAGHTQREPLTALEWLRVTHADTLSGRRIEEAIAAAVAAERAAAAREAAAVKAAVLDLADDLGTHTVEPKTDADRAFVRGLDYAARSLRHVVAAAVTEAGT